MLTVQDPKKARKGSFEVWPELRLDSATGAVAGTMGQGACA